MHSAKLITKLKHKAIAFLYTNDKHAEVGIKETISFTLAHLKSLELNLTEEAFLKL